MARLSILFLTDYISDSYDSCRKVVTESRSEEQCTRTQHTEDIPSSVTVER